MSLFRAPSIDKFKKKIPITPIPDSQKKNSNNAIDPRISCRGVSRAQVCSWRYNFGCRIRWRSSFSANSHLQAVTCISCFSQKVKYEAKDGCWKSNFVHTGRVWGLDYGKIMTFWTAPFLADLEPNFCQNWRKAKKLSMEWKMDAENPTFCMPVEFEV